MCQEANMQTPETIIDRVASNASSLQLVDGYTALIPGTVDVAGVSLVTTLSAVLEPLPNVSWGEAILPNTGACDFDSSGTRGWTGSAAVVQIEKQIITNWQQKPKIVQMRTSTNLG